MNVDFAINEMAMKKLNQLDNDVDMIQKMLRDWKNRDKVDISGDKLVVAIENDDKYLINFVSYYEYKNNTVLRDDIRLLCHEMMLVLDNHLEDKSFLFLLRNESIIIGICSFVFIERYFGIQAMFVCKKERNKGFGGCFLSLLQDFGRIVNGLNNILPIFLIKTK